MQPNVPGGWPTIIGQCTWCLSFKVCAHTPKFFNELHLSHCKNSLDEFIHHYIQFNSIKSKFQQIGVGYMRPFKSFYLILFHVTDYLSKNVFPSNFYPRLFMLCFCHFIWFLCSFHINIWSLFNIGAFVSFHCTYWNYLKRLDVMLSSIGANPTFSWTSSFLMKSFLVLLHIHPKILIANVLILRTCFLIALHYDYKA